MRLLRLAGDCPDAAGRAKVREEGRRVEKAGTWLEASEAGWLGLWHLHIEGKEENHDRQSGLRLEVRTDLTHRWMPAPP